MIEPTWDDAELGRKQLPPADRNGTFAMIQGVSEESLTSSHSAPAVNKPTKIVGMPNRFATTSVLSTKISADRSSRNSENRKTAILSNPRVGADSEGESIKGNMILIA